MHCYLLNYQQVETQQNKSYSVHDISYVHTHTSVSAKIILIYHWISDLLHYQTVPVPVLVLVPVPFPFSFLFHSVPILFLFHSVPFPFSFHSIPVPFRSRSIPCNSFYINLIIVAAKLYKTQGLINIKSPTHRFLWICFTISL